MNLIICLVALLVVAGGVVLRRLEKISKIKEIAMLIIAVLLIILSASFRIIPTGYTGVRTTFGQVDNVVVQNGFNVKIPFVQSIDKVNNKQQDEVFKGEIWGEANDKTVVFATDVVVTYQINPKMSAYIYANVSDYKKNLIPQTLVNSAVKSAMVGISSDQITNRTKIEAAAKTALTKSIQEKYNSNAIIINKVTIDNMDFEESYNRAIADKQVARQGAEKQAVENKRAVDLAKANQEKANVEAETKKIQAQGDANAMIIMAQAEAEAYRIKSSQITDNLLKKWELDARQKHGWVTIQGTNTVVTGQ